MPTEKKSAMKILLRMMSVLFGMPPAGEAAKGPVCVPPGVDMI